MMTRLLAAVAGVVCAVGAVGCHAGNSAPSTIDGNEIGSGSGGSGGSDGALPANFEELISRTFSVSPGEDDYRCIRIQVPDELWINAFEPLPDETGAHHQILTLTTGTPSQMGEYPCSDAIGPNDMQMLYASGIGTGGIELPDGYAVHLVAGTYVNLLVHVFDAGDVAITDGKAGVMVKKLTVASGGPAPKEVDFMFNGTKTLNIPYHATPGTTSLAQGYCAAPQDWTIFALWPHMHARGVKTSFWVQHGATKTTLLDDIDYSAASEEFYPMTTPVEVPAADTLYTTCTYDNNATNNLNHDMLHYGTTASDEMCFTGFYKYPASAQYGLYYCAQH